VNLHLLTVLSIKDSGISDLFVDFYQQIMLGMHYRLYLNELVLLKKCSEINRSINIINCVRLA